LGYFGSFYIIHKWIGIQKISILKHLSKSLWIVKPLTKEWLVKHMNFYVMCSKNDLSEVERMPNLKNLLGAQKSKFFKLLFMGVGAFMHVIRKGIHFLFMHFLQQMRGHNNMRSLSIQRLQGCVWKEKCWHFTRTLTMWLHNWLGRRCTTPIWTHL